MAPTRNLEPFQKLEVCGIVFVRIVVFTKSKHFRLDLGSYLVYASIYHVWIKLWHTQYKHMPE